MQGGSSEANPATASGFNGQLLPSSQRAGGHPAFAWQGIDRYGKHDFRPTAQNAASTDHFAEQTQFIAEPPLQCDWRAHHSAGPADQSAEPANQSAVPAQFIAALTLQSAEPAQFIAEPPLQCDGSAHHSAEPADQSAEGVQFIAASALQIEEPALHFAAPADHIAWPALFTEKTCCN